MMYNVWMEDDNGFVKFAVCALSVNEAARKGRAAYPAHRVQSVVKA